MATATVELNAPVQKKWAPPRIGVGSMVLWYKDGIRDRTPYPALVAKVGTNNNIDVIRYSFASGSGMLVVACRHVDDPDIKEHDRQNAGAWDLTDETKEMRKLLGK